MLIAGANRAARIARSSSTTPAAPASSNIGSAKQKTRANGATRCANRIATTTPAAMGSHPARASRRRAMPAIAPTIANAATIASPGRVRPSDHSSMTRPARGPIADRHASIDVSGVTHRFDVRFAQPSG